MMKLSVIVPVYNVEQFIRPCLESILSQGLDELDCEIILVNDGTQDNSFGQIEDLVLQHPNIIRIDQENQGLSGARNTGMIYSKGEYILFVDWGYMCELHWNYWCCNTSYPPFHEDKQKSPKALSYCIFYFYCV